jgi:hypothetical protein
VLATLLKVAVRLLLLPFLLIKWLLGGVVLLIVGPVLALVGIVMLVAFGAAVLLPLLPFLVLGGLIWLLFRAARPSIA